MATSKRNSKEMELSRDEVILIGRAVSDPRRFEIFERIASAGKGIGCSDLLKIVEITPATMSHHLKELETAGLIGVSRNGKFMQISLRRDRWRAYLTMLRRI